MVWFHATDGEKSGPLSLEDMQALLRAGHIDGDTKIWTAGFDGWRKLRDVEAFAAILTEVTPPSPPPSSSPVSVIAPAVASPPARRPALRRKVLVGIGGALVVAMVWLAWSASRGPSGEVQLPYECLAFHRVMLQKFRQEANAGRAAATEQAGRNWVIEALNHESKGRISKADGVKLMQQAEAAHRRRIAEIGWTEFERVQSARCVRRP